MTTGDGLHSGHRMTPLARVLSLLRPDLRDIWIVVIFAVAIGVLNLSVPVVAMAVVNTAALQTLGQQVLVLSAALFVALALAAFMQLLQTITVEYIQQRIFVRVVDDLAYRLPRVDSQAFDEQHGPELVNRFFDVLTVQKASATLLLEGVMIVLQTLIGLLLLAFYDNALIGYDVILLLSLVFMVFVLGRGAVGSAIQESIMKYRVAGWMEEVARHRIAFKLAGGPALARSKADALTGDYLEARHSHFRTVIRQYGFALFLQSVAIAGLLALGGYLVAQGQLTLGQLVAAEVVVTLVVASFTKFGKQFESFYDLLAAADKLGHLIDLPLERAGGEPHPGAARGARVAVQDVTFAYELHGRPAIQRFNLTLEPGEHVALTGPNGSGKSTLVELLFGLRQPEQGRIEIDHLDLRDLSLESVRAQTALAKGVEVFEGTVLENLRMGREAITLLEARVALESVGLLQTILELPGGLQTAMGTGGAPLSLGQVNRLMLARAIVGRPRLLILDETFDTMDRGIRDRVLPAIMARDNPWTLLVVTHSPEIAAMCDRTIVLERPKI